MNDLLRRMRSRPGLALALACAGLLLRTAVPVGFMPMESSAGSARLMLCPGHATVPQQPDRADEGSGGTREQRPAPCQFAFAAGTALKSDFITLLVSPAPQAAVASAIEPGPALLVPLRSHGARDPPPATTG